MRRRGIALLAACLIGAAVAALATGTWCERAQFGRLSWLAEAAVEAEPGAEGALRDALRELRGGGAEDDALLADWGYAPGDFAPAGRLAPLGICAAGLALGGGLLVGLEAARRRRLRARVEGLTRSLEAANAGRDVPLLPEAEDEFSPLQDEIEKTVGALRRERDAAVEVRARFAENLENIAHQLKTPIAAADAALQAGGADASERARRQLARLAALEEKLLALARLDSGVLTLAREPVDVYTALSVAVDGLMELSEARGVRVEIPEGEAVAFTGDLEWTAEALSNLIKNCLEHSPAGSAVRCAYAGNPLYAEIRISDAGPGFAREDLPHLFERFYRGAPGAAGGTGIGLALARSIVEAQGGAVSARNLPSGGACFEVRMYRH